MYLIVSLLVVTGLANAFTDNDVTCTKNGVPGICTHVLKCQSALDDINHLKTPQICSLQDATVCCFDHIYSVATTAPQEPITTTTQPQYYNAAAPPKLVATTTPRSLTNTTEYIPELNSYENMEVLSECEPIPTSQTAPKTGQKAWDKCIDYQEQLVYPCEPGALNGELTRKPHCYHNAVTMIVGGQSTERNEFPHMVMLGYRVQLELKWLCGGSLISERFVLTAGHCIKTAAIGPVTHVLVGPYSRLDANDSSKVYEVKRIIRYPEYKHSSKYHDIALLETMEEIKLNQFVVPACLHVGDVVDDSRACATGWGLTSPGGSESEELQKVILSKFETQECETIYPVREKTLELGFLESTQMCYGSRTKAGDTCQGDSGGPLQILSKEINCMYVVIGVTSFGISCGFVGQPAVYTRVAPYVSWIENIVWP